MFLSVGTSMRAARSKSVRVRNLMEWQGYSKGFEDVGGREESSWKARLRKQVERRPRAHALLLYNFISPA